MPLHAIHDWRLEIGQWDICQIPHVGLVVCTGNVLFETLPGWRKLLLLLGSLLKHTDYVKNRKHQKCCMASSQALQQSTATSSCVDMLPSTHHQIHSRQDDNGLPANHQHPSTLDGHVMDRHRSVLADHTRAQHWSIHSIDVQRATVCKGEGTTVRES